MSDPRGQGRHADRAAQFMPFAALTGYYDLVREQERVTEPRHELTEEEAEQLSGELARLRRGDLVRVTHYRDGAYVVREGYVSRLDLDSRELFIARERISLDDIRSLERPS